MFSSSRLSRAFKLCLFLHHSPFFIFVHYSLLYIIPSRWSKKLDGAAAVGIPQSVDFSNRLSALYMMREHAFSLGFNLNKRRWAAAGWTWGGFMSNVGIVQWGDMTKKTYWSSALMQGFGFCLCMKEKQQLNSIPPDADLCSLLASDADFLAHYLRSLTRKGYRFPILLFHTLFLIYSSTVSFSIFF